MTSDLDIYRSAKILIDEHGDDAAIEAAMRADELLDQGDLEGQRVWMRVVVVKELQRTEPHHDDMVH
jgi:hypothetical protein